MDLSVKENIAIALRAIQSQLLRTVLTVLIISIGIMALVGILTAIDALKASISSNFTSMGANTFTIRDRGMMVRIGNQGKGPKRYRAITYDEARRFSAEFGFPATVSVSTLASRASTVRYASKKTNPNMQVFGTDENYLATSGYEIENGRNFSAQDVEHGNHVALIGKDVARAIFAKKENPLNKVISIGSGKYKVIGVLKPKGNSAGFGGDKVCFLPVSNVRRYFSRPNMSYAISVVTHNAQKMETAIGEARGIFRIIRKVPLKEEDNFEVTKSDNLANMLIDNMKKVTIGATVIGFITLLGAAIGLMNIMLVSVTERTREIGVRKALGATRQTIKRQFLVEAVVICQLGGLLGILLGIAIGNLISFQLNVGFMVPWLWIISGIVLCAGVGLISGIYPAIKASRLDPIEALRFE